VADKDSGNSWRGEKREKSQSVIISFFFKSSI
jgi:hypothetical protein